MLCSYADIEHISPEPNSSINADIQRLLHELYCEYQSVLFGKLEVHDENSFSQTWGPFGLFCLDMTENRSNSSEKWISESQWEKLLEFTTENIQIKTLLIGSSVPFVDDSIDDALEKVFI